jgi:hypothetical protein
MTHVFNHGPFRMDRSLIVSTPSRTRPQLIRSDPQHLPSFNNKCHMSISHIRFHTTRCHTHMLLNQVTHVLFVHAHFLICVFVFVSFLIQGDPPLHSPYDAHGSYCGHIYCHAYCGTITVF